MFDSVSQDLMSELPNQATSHWRDPTKVSTRIFRAVILVNPKRRRKLTWDASLAGKRAGRL